jgi:cytochrome c
MKCNIVALAALISLTAFGAAFADGDAAEGEKVFKKCLACHAVGDDAKNKVGPQLNDLFGRTAGSLEDYKYSSAMTAKGEEGLVWTEETVTEYLRKPRDFVPKTKMAFAGLRKDEDIADVVAYLMQYSGEGTQDAAADGAEETEMAKADPAPEEAGPPDLSDSVMNDADRIAAGGEIWADQCRHCHGASAYPGKAPKLKPRRYEPDFVFDRVANGFRKMPAWKDVYSQDEIVSIVAYVKSKKFSP